MLTNAFALALVTSGGFMMVYKKFPRRLRKWIEKNALLADASALFLTYVLLGGTLTALTAGAMVGLMTSGLLHVAQNKEDFEYLIVAKDWVSNKVGELSSSLNMWARNLRKKEELQLAA
jgi:hypothetical protein